jgi:antitoxin CptB
MIQATDAHSMALRVQGTLCAMDDSELKRLKWRCRRGLLENELVLERFLELYGAQLTQKQAEAFGRLLDYGDKELWDLVVQRSEPGDLDLVEVVELLRSCWRGGH